MVAAANVAVPHGAYIAARRQLLHALARRPSASLGDLVRVVARRAHPDLVPSEMWALRLTTAALLDLQRQGHVERIPRSAQFRLRRPLRAP